MKTAVLLLNFGEPEHATLAEVVPFLERIFNLNATLEGRMPGPEAAARSRALAAARAPSLIAEYQAIGGSPLHAQARAHAEALAALLAGRGHDVVVLEGMQFTDPLIPAAVDRAVASGAGRIVALPVYPLCGPTTTVAALAEVAAVVRERAPDIELRELAGWHRHPRYLQLRADAVRATAAAAGLDLRQPGTRVVFSAHGTPRRYLLAGSRYDEYVRDLCHSLAADLGLDRYELGYQNHANRPGVEWTEPDIAAVVAAVAANAIIVDPVSFMHEQSETLAELDHELRGLAEARGLAFHRVMIPHHDPAFIGVLADLITPLLAGSPDANTLRRCRCRPTSGTFCLNGDPL